MRNTLASILIGITFIGLAGCPMMPPTDGDDDGNGDTPSDIAGLRFTATLAGDAERPNPVTTTTTGVATFEVGQDGTSLNYTVSVAGGVALTQAHIHLGGPEEAGGFVAFLFGPVDGGMDVDGELAMGTLTADNLVNELGGSTIAELVDEFLGGNAYLNVHSVANPGGEVRGQINADDGTRSFLVRIENVSTEEALSPSDGSSGAVPLSPGVWAVHADSGPFFTNGAADRGDGLEAIAEDGAAGELATALDDQPGIATSAAFDTPVGAEEAGAIGPGGAYEFTVTATPGSNLSFVTMFVPSNDLFFAPGEAGIALFDADGNPISGDVTDQINLWDAGTEVNQEPGVGADQVQRQAGPNTGADEGGVVVPVADEFTYPAIEDVILVLIKVQD